MWDDFLSPTTPLLNIKTLILREPADWGCICTPGDVFSGVRNFVQLALFPGVIRIEIPKIPARAAKKCAGSRAGFGLFFGECEARNIMVVCGCHYM